MKTLAQKLYDFSIAYDPYGAADEGYTLEKAKEDISDLKSAQKVISELLDIIEEMEVCL